MVECDPEYIFLGHPDTDASPPGSLSSSLAAASDPPLEDAREPWVRSDDDDDAMRDARRRRRRRVVKNIIYPACVRKEPRVFVNNDTGRGTHP